MLFWIFVAILIVGIVWGIYDEFSFSEVLIAALGFAAVLISSVFLIAEHACVDANVAKLEAERASLVYQYENDFYDNDNDVGKKELMNDILDYNKQVLEGRNNQKDFWIGIYYANIYDQFELIPLEKGEIS